MGVLFIWLVQISLWYAYTKFLTIAKCSSAGILDNVYMFHDESEQIAALVEVSSLVHAKIIAHSNIIVPF